MIIVSAILAHTTAQAKTLFGIVSERSAAELAAGANAFDKSYLGHKIILRTTQQIRGLDDDALSSLIQNADIILTLAVYGDMVIRLEENLKNLSRKTPFIAISSDRKLVKVSQKTIPSANYAQAKSYWHSRGQQNIKNLIALSFQLAGEQTYPGKLLPRATVRYLYQDKITTSQKISQEMSKIADKPWVAILDHDTGDRLGDIDLINQICTTVRVQGFQCVTALAKWGQSSIEALQFFQHLKTKSPLAALINLQDFVVGGGEGREEATQLYKTLDVPVLKGLKIIERTEESWRLSEDGLPWNSLHYRIAMPELQGTGQPHVLATAVPVKIDPLTGIALSFLRPHPGDITQMIRRISNWYRLSQMQNADKKLALIYYNHPPGRHNIGADNLNVPESLFEILHRLKAEGYETGPLPATSEKLLSLIQERAINLPEDRKALAIMAAKTSPLSASKYTTWFQKLPIPLQQEMINGPLFYLNHQLKIALKSGEVDLGKKLLSRIVSDVQHVLEGADHPARPRAQDLLQQLGDSYQSILKGEDNWQQAEKLLHALQRTHIEGLKGWGEIPGKIMTHEGKILIPGIQFGNVFIGPQPPRGWELNEELLHANMTFPPTHQYLAFYLWLHNEFKPNALIHLGRHSTYEFLPRHGSGVGSDDYSYIIAGDIPGLYPYIVDGVGEGIQAKRRGLAVMIDHLTPPLSTTPLYDDLLLLRQLIESYEATNPEGETSARIRALEAIRKTIDDLKLRKELEASMADELKIRGISFDEADGEFLIHEVGHYLTKLQEKFMPIGLHVFGRDWTNKAVDLMASSMSEHEPDRKAEFAELIARSPKAEIDGLLRGLNGGFIPPGKGNDPVRTPESLPTGRNFHALDSSLLPTRLGYDLGVELALKARNNKGRKKAKNGKEAVILWASDTVRDEGAMIAFGMDMLGIAPKWSRRGILQGIKRLKLPPKRMRQDTLFITSGLFRDLYGQQLVWLDKAVLLALGGSSEVIRRKHPTLAPALDQALAPLGELHKPGTESLAQNQIARNWVQDSLKALKNGISLLDISQTIHQRIFGTAPGAYGAGINRLVERSGSWQQRSELADAYIARMGHNYGITNRGTSAHNQFKNNIRHVDNIYLGRASNLYGLMDNNDAFDYMGGLSLAVEMSAKKIPQGYIIEHANPHDAKMEKLDVALLSELRGRFLNPTWLKPLMNEGYAGARTMGSGFLEYLWGWQVTNPDIVKSWVWDEVNAVYMKDKLGLGLDEFLENGDNIHVKSNMMALMLVAAQKEFWQADEETLQEMSRALADILIKHGLPGSGHTSPNHPIFDWIKPRLTAEQAAALAEILADAKGPEQDISKPVTTTISEIEAPMTDAAQEDRQKAEDQPEDQEENQPEDIVNQFPWLALFAIGFIILIFGTGLSQGIRHKKTLSPKKGIS